MYQSLRRASASWSRLGASPLVLNIVNKGYRIPFSSVPPSFKKSNNKSAFLNKSFVSNEVAELLRLGFIHIPSKPPLVCSPLSVAQNATKLRLVLDLSQLNKYVAESKFKLDDYKVLLPYLQNSSHATKFDLKSGYFHIEIDQAFHKYLGFSCEASFYQYKVLPFGLKTAPYIFTKLLRPLVAYLRKNDINFVLYLNDGIAVSPSFDKSQRDSIFIQKTLKELGLITAEAKCTWDTYPKSLMVRCRHRPQK